MSEYTNHEHKWKQEYNTGGLFSVKCSKCDLTMELYSNHISMTDYVKKDTDGLYRFKILHYDKLLQVFD